MCRWVQRTFHGKFGSPLDSPIDSLHNGRDEEAPYVGKFLMSAARLHPPDDPFSDAREIAGGEPRRRSQQLANRGAREKTPPCALDGGPPCECLLRLAGHGVPIHRELVHRI